MSVQLIATAKGATIVSNLEDEWADLDLTLRWGDRDKPQNVAQFHFTLFTPEERDKTPYVEGFLKGMRCFRQESDGAIWTPWKGLFAEETDNESGK